MCYVQEKQTFVPYARSMKIEDGLYPTFLLTSIYNIITIMYIGEHFISACLSQEMALVMAGAIAANRIY